jgi:predicted CXXCH cytochrome family protein
MIRALPLTAVAAVAAVAAGAMAWADADGRPAHGQLAGPMRTPVAVTFLADGALAVSEDATPAVSVFEPSGALRWSTTEALIHPAGLYASADGLWVADGGSGSVVQLDLDDGAVLRTVHVGDDLHPSDVVATEQGPLWVSASSDDLLLRIDPALHSMLVVDSVSGSPLEAPRGLAPDGHGGVWVVESLAGRVHRFSATGELVDSIGGWGIGAGRFAKPKDLAILPDGGLLVLDAQLGLVQRLDAEGRFHSVLADDEGVLRFDHPLGVAAMGDRVAVAEAGANRVTLIDRALSPIDTPFPEPASLVSYSSIKDMDPGLVCRQCHDGTRRQSPGIWDPEVHNHPMEPAEGTTLPEDIERNKEGQLTCFSCHGIHRPEGQQIPDDSGLEEESIVLACAHCHEDLNERSTTPTGNAHPVGKTLPFGADREALARITVVEDDKIACRTCHRPHGAPAEHLLVRSAEEAALCLTCHSGEADHRTGHPMDVEPDAAMRARLEARGALLTANGQLACLTCHDVHEAAGQPLLRFAGGALASCETCHEDKVEILADSVHHEKTCVDCHGMHRDNEVTNAGCGECHEDEQAAQDRGGHGDAVCRDCHRVHEDQPMDGFTMTATQTPDGTALNPFSIRCLSCHLPSAQPGLEIDPPRVAHYQHPVDVFTPDGEGWTSLGGMPLYGPDGAQLPPGAQGEVSCGTCHLTHGPAASGKRPQMRRAEWKQTCPMCHGPNALQFYQYFHYPDSR